MDFQDSNVKDGAQINTFWREKMNLMIFFFSFITSKGSCKNILKTFL